MKEAEAKLLIKTGNIDRATLYRERNEWEIWLYGDELPSSIKNPVELARGGRRTWASLDTAYKWLKEQDGNKKIKIDIDG